jgi:hypothetical protein
MLRVELDGLTYHNVRAPVTYACHCGQARDTHGTGLEK